MNSSKTSLSRSLSVNFRRSLRIIFAVALLPVLTGAINAQDFYANWTGTGDPTLLNFTLPDGTTGTVRRINTNCAAAGSPDNLTVDSIGHSPAFNYPSNYYTPTPPSPAEYLNTFIDRDGALPGCGAVGEVVATFVINFSEPVTNVRFNFYHVDNSVFRFWDSSMSPIPVDRLDGNPQFEVTGNAVNSTPEDFDDSGCAGPGTNTVIGCGTVAVRGKYTQLRMTATDISDSVTGDNFFITMSLFADYGDAPASYDNNGVNEANHDLLAGDLRLGASVDADVSERSTANAAGDDNAGSDDENGVISLDQYLPAGGMTCTGTLGTYTTGPNEYCAVVRVVNTGTAAQVVGWLDIDAGGAFGAGLDRSDPVDDPVVDDGSFATRNVPAGVTRNVILVWQSLPAAITSPTYARFRVTRDAAFLSDPSPLGAMIDGEVEDHRVTMAPTAADATIAGRVVTADGRGIRNVTVILQGGELSEPRVAVTGAFGYYMFEGLEVNETYFVRVQSKRYQFENPVRVVSLGEDATGVDFVASP